MSRSTCTIVRMTAREPAISVVPANEASWEGLQTILGARGQASRCQCQRYKLRRGNPLPRFPSRNAPT
jgi:hypothetical protein